MGSLTFALVVAYVAVNRLVKDVYVLPVGLSIHPSEVILVLVILGWLMWMITEPAPLPRGIVGFLGVALLVVVGTAPFINGLDMTEFQANGAERGLVQAALLAGLFLAAYRIAYDRRRAYLLLAVTVGFSIVQALMAIYESATRTAVSVLGSIWLSIGLQVDPRGLRGEELNLAPRLSGELRALATAPHPLVLTSLLAMAVGVTVVLYLHADSRRARLILLGAVAILLVGVGATASRTGFVMLAVLGLFIAVVSVPQIPRAMPLVGIVIAGGIGIALTAPNTPRLILDFFTGRRTDNSVDIRLERTASIPELLERRPAIGAGYLTGDPSVIIFDNGYFTELIELGIIGLALLVAFFLAILVRCYGTLSIAPEADRPLLLAGVIAAISLLIASATYDTFSFDQFLPTTLLVMGVGLARADLLRRAQSASS